ASISLYSIVLIKWSIAIVPILTFYTLLLLALGLGLVACGGALLSRRRRRWVWVVGLLAIGVGAGINYHYYGIFWGTPPKATWFTGNYSGVYEVSRVSALRSESEAAQTIPIQDFQSLKPAFFRDPLNGYVYRGWLVPDRPGCGQFGAVVVARS
ncbi:MAG: hypothetical protein ACO331_12235, partial [Prochlorothrix sp.]